MINIDISDETGILKEEHFEVVRHLIEMAADGEEIPDETEVSITFVDNDKIQELNRTYRNIDRSTDVLSFAFLEDELETEIVGAEVPGMLGDIVISTTKAKEQADQYNHSFIRELGFLAVHGFLHLCGYDHMNDGDEKRMFSRQEEVLERYGLQR
ncbi:MAG TPA: rRNA maturation RNase YbeY [Bacillales bacterium]|nr:rRNA maturation RNase YbeY [Bacillales bacterium]